MVSRFENSPFLEYIDAYIYVIECVQLQITGGGSEFPTTDYLKPIPGAFTQTDPVSDWYLTEWSSFWRYCAGCQSWRKFSSLLVWMTA